jgi:ribosomal protein S18 acetylase RimI-like enzyme
MKITFTYATQKYFKWLKEKDHHIDAITLKKKIADKQIILAKSESGIIGWLRFGLFWDSIPFMNMLFIEGEYQSKGVGKKIVQFWETEMKKKKHKVVMTSSQSDEEAQHFYRKLGYADKGSLTLPKEPLELIFIKEL